MAASDIMAMPHSEATRAEPCRLMIFCIIPPKIFGIAVRLFVSGAIPFSRSPRTLIQYVKSVQPGFSRSSAEIVLPRGCWGKSDPSGPAQGYFGNSKVTLMLAYHSASWSISSSLSIFEIIFIGSCLRSPDRYASS